MNDIPFIAIPSQLICVCPVNEGNDSLNVISVHVGKIKEPSQKSWGASSFFLPELNKRGCPFETASPVLKSTGFRYLFSESDDLVRDVLVEPDAPIPVVPVFEADAPEL